jgi:UDP-glucose 4-epimerase
VHVVDDLSSGRRENVSDEASLHVLDVREPLVDALADVRPDVVFHLAAQVDVRVSVADPVLDARTNVLGTVNVLELARRHDAQVIFASTGGAIYGECETRPARENDERQPLSPYGTSKLAGEEYLATWNRLHGTRHVAVRLGNVYGPRQDPHGEAGVVAIFLSRIASGQPATIFGDGGQTRDYVFVGDVVRAFVAAVGAGGGVYNVGTGIETSVLELWHACTEAAGVEAQVSHDDPRLGELRRSCLDNELAERELRWRPEMSLHEGLRRTWEWIREE